MISAAARYGNSFSVTIKDCTCKFEGNITEKEEQADLTAYLIDGAIIVKDISDKTRLAALQQLQPPIVRDVAAGLGILGLTYFITQITSATLDQTILLKSLSHRRIFATILLVTFAVHSFFSFLRMIAEHPDTKFLTTYRVSEVQNARKLAAQDPLSLLKTAANFDYFHNGELLKLIVDAYKQPFIRTNEEKLKHLQNMDPIMSSVSLWNRFTNEHAEFRNTIYSEWFALKIECPNRGEVRRLNLPYSTTPAPTFNQEQWDKAGEIFQKISEKAESIQRARSTSSIR
ncbi:MAG: hypothetical protein ABSA17_03385 [Rhabdochlamydiaceae bacterium]